MEGQTKEKDALVVRHVDCTHEKKARSSLFDHFLFSHFSWMPALNFFFVSFSLFLHHKTDPALIILTHWHRFHCASRAPFRRMLFFAFMLRMWIAYMRLFAIPRIGVFVGHDFQRTCFELWPVYAFSWASICFECRIALAPDCSHCTRVSGHTHIYAIYICGNVYGLRSLLNTLNIKQINYRLHSRTWHAQEIKQWQKWIQNSGNSRVCISNAYQLNEQRRRHRRRRQQQQRWKIKKENTQSIFNTRLLDSISIYSYINRLGIYRL